MTDHLFDILTVRCNDTNYNDFMKSFHQEALKYANRKIARKYSLLTRYYSFKCIAENESATVKPVKLKLHSFSEEIKIMVNDVEYDRGMPGKLNIEENQYELYWGTDSYLFNYTNRSLEDVIQMTYMAEIGIDDFDDKSVTPVIPEKYDDEVLRYALIYIAEAGIAKFKGAVQEKYLRIYELNSNKKEGTENGEKKTCPSFKAFKVI